jgi:hypothetical protein
MNLNINFSKKYTPESNFYLWVNQGWKDENYIPDDYQSWGSFNSLEQENKLKIKNLLEKGDVDIKCKILYEQGLKRKDNNEINKFLDEIQNCLTLDKLLNISIALYLMFHINHPINFCVYNDFTDSDINILHLDTDGLELPDRDYYFLKSKNKERNEYKIFLRKYADYFKLFTLDIESIYNIELELAEATLTNVQKRNIDLQNKKISDALIPLKICATNITKKELTIFQGNFPVIKALRASCCIPLIFCPQEINGSLYIDGGYLTNIILDFVPPVDKEKTLCLSIAHDDPKLTPQNISKVSHLEYLYGLYKITCIYERKKNAHKNNINLYYNLPSGISDVSDRQRQEMIVKGSELTRRFLSQSSF